MARTTKTAARTDALALDPLDAMLARLKLTGIRDRLDTLLDEAAHVAIDGRA